MVSPPKQNVSVLNNILILLRLQNKRYEAKELEPHKSFFVDVCGVTVSQHTTFIVKFISTNDGSFIGK